MTKERTEKYLYWFNHDYKGQRKFKQKYSGVILLKDASERYWKKAEKAKVVLGVHLSKKL